MPIHKDQHARWWEQPLPLGGLYSCVTMQMNLTYHTVSDSVKYVASLRDPVGGIELCRWSMPLEEYSIGVASWRNDQNQILTDLGSLRRSELRKDS